MGREDLPHADVRVPKAVLTDQDVGDALGGPEIGLVPEGERALCEDAWESGHLVLREASGSPGSGLRLQGRRPSGAQPQTPVVDRLRGDAEALSNLGWLHAMTEELEPT